jgi:hypothetical protein
LGRLRKLTAQALSWQMLRENKVKIVSAGAEKNFKDFSAS